MSLPSLSPERVVPAEPELVVESPAMREVIAAALDVAPTRTTVLLHGESGTGKELVARFIHRHSPRARGPWVAVNCATIPSELLESELFGHERGAFTGAIERRPGRFEQANHGTLLLDEASELPLPLQAKLLRVIQEREVDRIGGSRPVAVDVRIIATTNRDLAEMVAQGTFRADLYYRLNVFPIRVPPLSERKEAIPALCRALIASVSKSLGREPPALSAPALTALCERRYPGNVRELANLVERALVRCRGPVLELHHFGLDPAPPPPGNASIFPPGLPLRLDELERLAIAEALRRVGGNRTHAARLLGIGLRTLRNRLQSYRRGGMDPVKLATGQSLPTRGGSISSEARPSAPACRLPSTQV